MRQKLIWPKPRQKLDKLCAALRAVMRFGDHDQPYAPGDLKLVVVGRRSPRIPHWSAPGPWFGKRSNWVRQVMKATA